jgi:hypothetical protein
LYRKTAVFNGTFTLKKSNCEKDHCGGRLSFKTQLKIEYLLPYTGSRKVLENIPDVDVNSGTIVQYNNSATLICLVFHMDRKYKAYGVHCAMFRQYCFILAFIIAR